LSFDNLLSIGTVDLILPRQNIELAYFYLRFWSQSLLVCRRAGRGTKLHVPVAMNTMTEFSAAVIAAQSGGWAQTVTL
jgi:hypothetical protein